jgi:ABC-type cobalamin transport system ATPase subunit
LKCSACRAPLTFDNNILAPAQPEISSELAALRKQRLRYEEARAALETQLDGEDLPEYTVAELAASRAWFVKYITENQILEQYAKSLLPLTADEADQALKARAARANITDAETQLVAMDAAAAKIQLCSEMDALQALPDPEAQNNRARYEEAAAAHQAAENHYRALLNFRALLQEEEIKYILSIISEVETLVNQFAAALFHESIEIKFTFTSLNSDKSQLQVQIQHRGRAIGTFSNLSGGEQARVNLACLLAFAHVFESKLLLLDETLSQLDAAAASLAIEVLREHAPQGCKVLLIAHQIVEGSFEDVLRLERAL